MTNRPQPTITNEVIKLHALTKVFGKVPAVEELTLSINHGEVFGLLGPNGAGKTTTIRMLSALIAPTSGNAQIYGYKLGADDHTIRRTIGILTESPGLYESLSAEKNLSFFAKMYDIEDISSRIEKYLRMLGLWERRHEMVGTYSKGMRQKLALARALLHEPKVLLLDEPTSNLDPAAARLIRQFIASIKQEGRTIVLCTHNLDEADRLCDRIAVLKTKLIALDTPENLRRKLFGRTVVFHLREIASPFIEAVEQLAFVHNTEVVDNKLLVKIDNPEQQNPMIVRTLVNAGADIQFVGELRHRLEDIYLQLVNEGKEA